MKKKTLLFYLVLFAGVQVFGQGDSWKKITSVPGCTARTYSVAFSINGKGYYGTGIDSVTNKENSDIWMYDSGQDSWTQVASLPVKSGASVYNVGRSAASAFTVNDMGYVVGGYSSDLNIFLKDVWEFDAATNTWTSKADFPGFARAYAIAVGSDMWGAGFYGTGFSFKQGAGWTTYNDFWQFNPATNQWAMRPSLPVARGKAASFVITPAGAAGECVYVVGGNALFGQTAYLNDCYKFDPAILTWTGGPALPGYARENIIAFSANNKGYAGFGESTSGYYNDLYMFDGNANGVTGAWSLMPKLTAGGRTASSAFAIGGSGYIVGGRIATGLTSETWSFNTETNTWAERANSDVGVRNGASGFTVNGEGYIAGGYDGGSSGTDARSYGDFFRYDAGAGTWSKVNGINGNPFVYAPSFVIHNIAYIFMANPNGDGTYLLWSYDPATNLWSQRSTLFYGCDAFFCINDIAYGISTSNGYLTAYDPGVNGWAYKASFPGLTQDGGYNRSGGIAFAVNGKGYYGLGRAGNTYAQDIWQYNPATDEWQQKSDFAGGGRANAVSFSVDNIAYVGTGNNSEAFGTTDFWKYNDAKDTWERVADFIGGPRQLATSFVVDKKAYVGTGDDDYMNVANPVGTHKDFYEYTPAGSTLPVSIINFTAKKQGAGVVLSWQTTYEQNTASFIIERSTDGNLFTNIGNVKAAGNSAVVLSYSYMDLPGKWPANKLYYRIKETDVNGRVTNTNIAMVSVSNQIKATIYPNPVKNVLYLQGENIKTVIIIDNTGREVFKQNVTGTTQVINLSSFAAGKYTLRYIAKDGSAQSESIIKQ